MMDNRATMRGNPGDSARKRGLRKIFIPILSIGILFGIAVGTLLGSAGVLAWWVGCLIFMLAFIALIIFQRTQKALVYGYFKGARGEEMVAGELARLPSSWTIFNGLILPNGSDIDHVAIGPQGIFVIETKHWLGEVSIEDGKLFANGRSISKSPITQVRNSTSAIADFLQLDLRHVHGFLCFAGPQFKAAPQHIDEVTIISYLDLVAQFNTFPEQLNATETASYVTRLGALSVTQEF